MFKAKLRRINVQKLYINQHTIDNFEERKSKEIDLTLPKEVQIFILVQRSKDKNTIKMNELKGVIQLKNKLFMLVNIYESPGGELSAKALTFLTLKQLNGASWNFPQLNHLSTGFITDAPEIIREETFFDLEVYKDYLKQIEWDECEVNYV